MVEATMTSAGARPRGGREEVERVPLVLSLRDRYFGLSIQRQEQTHCEVRTQSHGTHWVGRATERRSLLCLATPVNATTGVAQSRPVKRGRFVVAPLGALGPCHLSLWACCSSSPSS